MISMLVTLIVLCIIGGLLYWLVSLLPLPAPFPMVIRVCVILVMVLILIGMFFGGVDVPQFRGRF